MNQNFNEHGQWNPSLSFLEVFDGGLKVTICHQLNTWWLQIEKEACFPKGLKLTYYFYILEMLMMINLKTSAQFLLNYKKKKVISWERCYQISRHPPFFFFSGYKSYFTWDTSNSPHCCNILYRQHMTENWRYSIKFALSSTNINVYSGRTQLYSVLESFTCLLFCFFFSFFFFLSLHHRLLVCSKLFCEEIIPYLWPIESLMFKYLFQSHLYMTGNALIN